MRSGEIIAGGGPGVGQVHGEVGGGVEALDQEIGSRGEEGERVTERVSERGAEDGAQRLCRVGAEDDRFVEEGDERCH